jgi:type I restriction enzyme S subunit
MTDNHRQRPPGAHPLYWASFRSLPPDDWTILPVGDLATTFKGKLPSRVLDTPSGRTKPYLLMDGLRGGTHVYTEETQLPSVTEEDTVVIADGPKSGFAVRGVSGILGSTLLAFRARKHSHPSLLFHMLSSLFPLLNSATTGTAIPHLDQDFLLRLRLGVPPTLDEQAAIARILDAVDTALERTRAAVERARELKRALMGELLPPWIGFRDLSDQQTPTGVNEIVRADFVCDVCNGSTPSRVEGRYWRQGTIPWLATGKVHDRVITAADEFVTDAALRECSIRLLPKGTVLVGMIGQGRTRGMCAYLGIDACINQNFGAFTPKAQSAHHVCGKWLFYYFDFYYSRLREIGGGTNQGALNCYLLKRLRLPLPDFDRQNQVASLLDAVEALEIHGLQS